MQRKIYAWVKSETCTSRDAVRPGSRIGGSVLIWGKMLLTAFLCMLYVLAGTFYEKQIVAVVASHRAEFEASTPPSFVRRLAQRSKHIPIKYLTENVHSCFAGLCGVITSTVFQFQPENRSIHLRDGLVAVRSHHRRRLYSDCLGITWMQRQRFAFTQHHQSFTDKQNSSWSAPLIHGFDRE